MITYQQLGMLILLLLIIGVPHLNDKNKFRLNLVTDGLLNKLIILSIILFVMLENYVLGLLSVLLYFTTVNETKKGSQTMEGFINYFK